MPSQAPPTDLKVPALSQLPLAELPLGDALEPGPLGGASSNEPLGGWVAPGAALEDAPRDPNHPAVLTDLDPNSTACRSAPLERRLRRGASGAILLTGS